MEKQFIFKISSLNGLVHLGGDAETSPGMNSTELSIFNDRRLCTIHSQELHTGKW